MKKNIMIISIVVIVTITILFFRFYKEKDYSNDEINEINYSYGGGFGTIIDTAQKTITFTPDGKVKLSNTYNSYTESFHINQNKYNELSNFILKHISLFDEKPKEDMNVMDGGSYYIRIKLKNGETKEIGGYMIKNKKFHEIEDKIFEIVDTKRRNQYTKNI